MFESTLRLGPLSAAVIGHLAVLSAIVAVTALIVPPVPPTNPPDMHVFTTVFRPPDPGLERPGAGGPKKGNVTAKPTRSVAPQPPIQPPAPPDATADTLSPPSDVPSSDGLDGPGDGGPGPTNGTGTGLDESPGGGGGPGEGGEPVFITADVVEPKLLVRVEPSYPEVPRKARLGGRVTVKAVVGLDGSVESAEIFASTSPLFNAAAIGAVRQWRYRPALMNGKPVRVYFTVVVEFSVR